MIAQFQIINKVLQNKDYSFITLNNLSAEHFYAYKSEYEFIKAHYANYHTVPDRLTFVQHFPEFTIQDVNEPDNYLIEQLFNDYNQSYLATRLNNLKKFLEADDTAGAMRYFQESLDKLHIGSALQCTDIMSDISRYDRFLDMTVNQAKYFISTGFAELDQIITGIDRRNENMVIAARTGIGKTTFLLAIAAAVSQQGLTVGIYSGEMSVDKVAYRIDTLIGKIDNKKISRGDLYYKDHYKNYLDSLKCANYGPIKVLTPNDIAGPATVDALQAFIEKEHLDMLCIDQHSLMEDQRRAKDPVTRAANISTDLKQLQVLRQIPIIAVSQQNRAAVDDSAVIDVSRIAQSDKIGQDSTVVIFLEQKDNVMTLHLAKARDGGSGQKLKYAIDLDKGIFSYIANEDDALDGQQCQDLQKEFEPNYSYSGGAPF